MDRPIKVPISGLRIVADRNIALVEAAFAGWGEVVALPASQIDAAAVREADLLLVRSTVKVGEALLSGSRVRFVATATIGTDHLDLPYLQRAEITVASAPGSNAASVAEWWATALVTTALARGESPFGRRIGIVGVGNVGRRIERVARALSDDVWLCDPPRAATASGFVALDELLPQVDLLTLHTPLEASGPHRTVGLIDGAKLARLPRGAWLVNASRGEVLDGDALQASLSSGAVGAALLDVFAGEPRPDPRLVAASAVATPHIAGHSFDGKVAGTRMVYEAACRFAGVAPTWTPQLPAPSIIDIAEELDDVQLLAKILTARYSIADDDRALRAASLLSSDAYGAAFSRYRQTYPERRELGASVVRLPASAERPLSARVAAVLSALSVAPARR